MTDRDDYNLGFQHLRFCKAAADSVVSYGLQGRLVMSASGWVLLEVPNAVVRGLFDALQEPGIELPLHSDGRLNAHISVMRPEELASIGNPRLSEIGHHFSYTLGPLKTCVPAGWEGMSRVWFIEVQSPSLKQLRRSYGLTALPNNDKFEFHITIARRRKNVLHTNTVSKAASWLQDLCQPPEDSWKDVPARIATEITQLRKIAGALQQLPLPLARGDAVFYDPACNLVRVWTKEAADWTSEFIYSNHALPGQRWMISDQLPEQPEAWRLIKVAGGYLQPLADGWQALHAPLGGVRPLTSALVGGLLAGGVGYAGGKLVDRVAPDEYFEEGKAPQNMAILGAMLGASPGVAWGLGQNLTNPATQRPFSASGAGWLSKYPWQDKSAGEDMTGITIKSIPVDAFNQAVWNDVAAVPNPFGTKSPWGDNDQPMRTPANVAAAVSGLVSGTSALQGNATRVSPFDIAMTAATSGLKGWTAGLAAGKVLGTLAGLKPEYQQKLQTAGLWGGLLTGAVKSLFGGP